MKTMRAKPWPQTLEQRARQHAAHRRDGVDMNLNRWMLIAGEEQLGKRCRRRPYGLDLEDLERAQCVVEALTLKNTVPPRPKM